SNVNMGFCRPITHMPTVHVNGHDILNHQEEFMWMNCAGPEGPGNTVGRLYFFGFMTAASVPDSGDIPSGDPPVWAERSAESGFMSSVGSQFSSAEGIVGMAKQAYGLGTMDWSNPGSVLGAIGGVAGLGGLGDVAQMAGLAQMGYGLATTDWSNPAAALG